MEGLKRHEQYWLRLNALIQKWPTLEDELSGMWNAGSHSALGKAASFLMLCVVLLLLFVGSFCNSVECYSVPSMASGGLHWAFKNYFDNVADFFNILAFLPFYSYRNLPAVEQAAPTKPFLRAAWIAACALLFFFGVYNVYNAPATIRPGWHGLVHNCIDSILNHVSSC